MLIVEVYRRRM